MSTKFPAKSLKILSNYTAKCGHVGTNRKSSNRTGQEGPEEV
jgi:hypothetical protein